MLQGATETNLMMSEAELKVELQQLLNQGMMRSLRQA